MKNISIYKYNYPLFVIGILFFVFGFLTWVNGVLIPYFKICMQLNNFQATLVAFSAYFAYFVMAMPSALLLERIGYRKGMVFGLCIMSIGTLTFIPAAYSRYYPLFLGGLFNIFNKPNFIMILQLLIDNIFVFPNPVTTQKTIVININIETSAAKTSALALPATSTCAPGHKHLRSWWRQA